MKNKEALDPLHPKYAEMELSDIEIRIRNLEQGTTPKRNPTPKKKNTL